MTACGTPNFAGYAGVHQGADGPYGLTDNGLAQQRGLQLMHEAYQLQKQLSPIKTCQAEPGRDSDAGGAQSGHSDATHLMPASATAAAADTGSLLAAHQRQPASPDSVVTAPKPAAPHTDSPASAAPAGTAGEEHAGVADLAPLPPPDVSEGPEAAAEYEVYLQRWDAGDTLAQRWHRLTAGGKLGDIRADWEDWQLDLMLQQVKERTRLAQAQQQRSGAVTPNATGTRTRRRGDIDEAAAAELILDEPRRVRSRRAPSTLQDYHVDRSGRTPDRQDAAAAGAGADTLTGSRQVHQQLLLQGMEPGADGSDDSTDEGAGAHNTAPGQQYNHHLNQQLQQQQQGGRSGIPRGIQQQPSRRPGSRLQRPMQPQQLQQQQQQQQPAPAAARQQQFARPGAAAHVAPFSPQQQQAQHPQQQMQQQLMMMQQMMMQMQAGAAGGGSQLGSGVVGGQLQQQQQQQQVPPEMTQMWFKIGTALGSMMQEKGGPANLLTNPAAMTSLIESVLKQTTGDPDAAMQQLAATLHSPPQPKMQQG